MKFSVAPPAFACPGIARSLLASLRCPYCGEPFRTQSIDSGDAVRFGVLECACCNYPVVEGIPILQQIDGLDRIVERVRSRDLGGALLWALDAFRVQWAHRTRAHRLLYLRNCAALASRLDISFEAAAHLVRRPKVFADYLVHRYANPSFLAALGVLGVFARTVASGAQGRPGVILEVACGAGHASYVLRSCEPDVEIVSTDQDFVNVYLARRFLGSRASHLCLDAQLPNPFPDRSFDGIYCQDAFHYIAAKRTAVAELKRVVRPDAVWLFPHLHNKDCINLVPGVPLTATGYLRCMDLAEARLFPEADLLGDLAQAGVVDLRREFTAEELGRAPDLTLIGGESGIFQRHEGIGAMLSSPQVGLTVNPIYRSQPDKGGLRLTRQWPNAVMERECVKAEAVLPAEVQISGPQLGELRAAPAGRRPAWLQDLVARFVLVALPRGYVSQAALVAPALEAEHERSSAPSLQESAA